MLRIQCCILECDEVPNPVAIDVFRLSKGGQLFHNESLRFLQHLYGSLFCIPFSGQFGSISVLTKMSDHFNYIITSSSLKR